MGHLRSIFILAFAFSGLANYMSAQAEAQPQDATAHLLPEHREPVEQWLLKNPNLRPAVDKDCVEKRFVADGRASFEGYHPYYLVADFNGDKRDDFAIAVVDTKKRTAKFAIAVFNGPVSKNSNPAFFREGYDFSRRVFTAADGIADERLTTLFVENLNTGRGFMLSPGRKGYFFTPSETDFN